MNKIKKLVATLTVLGIMCLNYNNVHAKEIYYSNERGVELSYEEYSEITKYIDSDKLKLFSQEEIDYLYSHISENGIETDVKYVKTTYVNEIITNECYVTEKDMIDSFNVINIPVQVRYLSVDDRYDSVQTTMKKISMSMYSVAPSAKKVSITCEWLSLPITRTYDVIAFRVDQPATFYLPEYEEDVYGYQYYDGDVIKYHAGCENIKTFSNGIGISMNIVNSVSTSLKMEFATNIGSGADPLTVYGTYQHSVDDITLHTSQRYSLSASGMGGVLKFNSSSVANHFDNTPGLCVTGSLYDE